MRRLGRGCGFRVPNSAVARGGVAALALERVADARDAANRHGHLVQPSLKVCVCERERARAREEGGVREGRGAGGRQRQKCLHCMWMFMHT